MKTKISASIYRADCNTNYPLGFFVALGSNARKQGEAKPALYITGTGS